MMNDYNMITSLLPDVQLSILGEGVVLRADVSSLRNSSRNVMYCADVWSRDVNVKGCCVVQIFSTLRGISR